MDEYFRFYIIFFVHGRIFLIFNKYFRVWTNIYIFA